MRPRAERHLDVATRIQDLIKQNMQDIVSPGDVRIEEYPFQKQPPQGLSISILEEQEGVGLNDCDDIRYRCQLTLVRTNSHSSQGIKIKSIWRNLVRDIFHRKRIGVPGAQEIITTVTSGTINIRKAWTAWGIDSNVMVVNCLIREQREN